MTEVAGLAVTSLYPTLLPLAQAYTMLVSPLLIGTVVTSVCTHTSLAAPRAIDVQNNRLFISDSNHNRIVSICTFTLSIYFSVPAIVIHTFLLN